MPEEKLLSAIYENDVEQARHLLSQLNTSHPMFRASRGKLLCSACIYSDGKPVRWLGARLWNLQCHGTGDTTALPQAIHIIVIERLGIVKLVDKMYFLKFA